MQTQHESDTHLEFSNFSDSGIGKLLKLLSKPVLGFLFTVDHGRTPSEQFMRAHTFHLLTQTPVFIIGTSFGVPYFNDRKRFRAIATLLTQFSKNTYLDDSR